MNQMKTFVIASILAFGFSATVQAAPPHLPDLVKGGNRWTITAYNDSSPSHTQWATQGLCFFYDGVVGTHQRYRWVSDTYPDWNGVAVQEGDQVFMHGDFQWPPGVREGGHDSMDWEIVTRSRKNGGAGHWKEWVDNNAFGQTIGFANADFQRVGRCNVTSFTAALEKGQHIEQPFNQKGELLTNPFGFKGQGQKSFR